MAAWQWEGIGPGVESNYCPSLRGYFLSVMFIEVIVIVILGLFISIVRIIVFYFVSIIKLFLPQPLSSFFSSSDSLPHPTAGGEAGQWLCYFIAMWG